MKTGSVEGWKAGRLASNCQLFQELKAIFHDQVEGWKGGSLVSNCKDKIRLNTLRREFLMSVEVFLLPLTLDFGKIQIGSGCCSQLNRPKHLPIRPLIYEYVRLVEMGPRRAGGECFRPSSEIAVAF